MMKKAFTLIELIFIVIIIGILASVAISKLAATRDDAKVTNINKNIKELISNIQNSYTALGRSILLSTRTPQITNVLLYANPTCQTLATNSIFIGSTLYLCVDSLPVLMITSANDGTYIQFRQFDSGRILDGILTSNSTFQNFTADRINGRNYKRYIFFGERIIP